MFDGVMNDSLHPLYILWPGVFLINGYLFWFITRCRFELFGMKRHYMFAYCPIVPTHRMKPEFEILSRSSGVALEKYTE